jgi:uncharacterized membrane protein
MRTGFVAFLFLIFLFAIVTGWDWPEGAKVYVLVTAFAGLALVAIDLLRTTVMRRREKEREKTVSELINKREIIVFASLLAYALGVYIIGAVVASMLFVFAFLKFYSGSKWYMSALGAFGMGAFLWSIGEFVGLAILEGLIRFNIFY